MYNIRKTITIVAIFLVSTLYSTIQAAEYYTYNGNKLSWPTNESTMNISTISMPLGTLSNTRIQSAMNEWNAVAGSNFTYNIAHYSENVINTANGRNEIAFVNMTSAELGVTYFRTDKTASSYKILETDIHMDVNPALDWYYYKFNGLNIGERYNFELAVLHELGNALGLKEQYNISSTMHSSYFYGGSIGFHLDAEPHADDRLGIRTLYPDSSTERDLSVSRFSHGPLGISPVNYSPLSFDGTSYTVQKGYEYDIGYTVENLGTQTENTSLQFYISTNTYISTADIQVGSKSLTIQPGTSVTGNNFDTVGHPITIPSGLPSGTYYIGYIVDPYSLIPESTHSNNYIALMHSIIVE